MSNGLLSKLNLRAWVNARWKIALLSVGGLIALLFIVWLVLTLAAHPAVERELARIRAKGEPISRRGLDPRPGPNDEEASALLEQVLDGLPWELSVGVSDHGFDEERAQWLDCLEGPFEPNREKAEHALAAGADTLALAEEALELLPFHYGRLPSWRRQRNIADPVVLTAIGKLFAVQALLRAHTGSGEEAADSLDNVFRTVRVFLNDASDLIGDYGLPLASTGLDVLGRIERLGVLSDRSRHELLEGLHGLNLLQAPVDAMLGGRVMTLEDVRWIRDSGALRRLPEDRPGCKGQRPRLASPTLFDREVAAYLRRMAEWIEAARLPPWEALPALRRIEERPVTFRGHTHALRSDLYRKAVDVSALRDAAVLGLALVLYRSARGEYPDSLDALVPEFLAELPPDPFTGKPFIYRRRADGAGFIVYSVGPNLADDAGVSDPDAGKDDIAWERKPPEEPARGGEAP